MRNSASRTSARPLAERHRDYFFAIMWVSISSYYAPCEELTCYRTGRSIHVLTSNPASGPGDSDLQDGGACLVAPWGTGLTAAVAVADSSGSAEQPLGSCRLEAWPGCWGACGADPVALGHGCPRATRPCRCRHRLHHHLRALGHSDRPAGVLSNGMRKGLG